MSDDNNGLYFEYLKIVILYYNNLIKSEIGFYSFTLLNLKVIVTNGF